MSLFQLEIKQLRNLEAVSIHPGPRFNIFVGANGSGKSSLLEAIHYLGLSRSFRTHLNQRIINTNADAFSVVGHIHNGAFKTVIGIERHRQQPAKTRIGGENITSSLELAKAFPLQFLNSDAHRLLLGGPKYRREFIDWGVFHVEHHFISLWQHAYRALRQRNAALRQCSTWNTPAQQNQVRLWDRELASATESLTLLRQHYVEKLLVKLSPLLPRFLGDTDLKINFYPGWHKGTSFAETLAQNFPRDIELGYTQYGPQKADLTLKVGNVSVQDMFSQGQQKLLVYAMRLAQGMLLQEETGKTCTYLIDDLPAELDRQKRRSVLSTLANEHVQVFITGTDLNDFAEISELDLAVKFHVEHGKIRDHS